MFPEIFLFGSSLVCEFREEACAGCLFVGFLFVDIKESLKENGGLIALCEAVKSDRENLGSTPLYVTKELGLRGGKAE